MCRKKKGFARHPKRLVLGKVLKVAVKMFRVVTRFSISRMACEYVVEDPFDWRIFVEC